MIMLAAANAMQYDPVTVPVKVHNSYRHSLDQQHSYANKQSHGHVCSKNMTHCSNQTKLLALVQLSAIREMCAAEDASLAPVIGKSHFIASLLGINDPLIVQIKQVGVAVSVIRFASPICLAMINQLSSVLCHKLVLAYILLQKSLSAALV